MPSRQNSIQIFIVSEKTKVMNYFLARNLHIYDSLRRGKNSEAIILKYPSNYRQCDSSWSVEPSNRLSEITPLLCIYTCIIKLNCLSVIIISQKILAQMELNHERETDRQTETEARTGAIRRCSSNNGTRPSPKGSKRQHRTEKFARSRDWTPSINQTWSHLALLIAPFRASCLYPNPSIPILIHHHHPPTRDCSHEIHTGLEQDTKFLYRTGPNRPQT